MHELSTVWFWLVAALITGWVALDGFVLGTGMLHRFVARSDHERQQVFASIIPVRDGNEVWLVTFGGSFFLAFPKIMGSALSGFYLPVIFVLWALLVRGLSIELRAHLHSPLWRSFFDTGLVVGSLATVVLMGAALGNLVRGVPLRADGWFELPLWTNFATSGDLGALDWFTVMIAVFAVVVLAAHGANWLVWKTDGVVQGRALAVRTPLWVLSGALWLGVVIATFFVAPELLGFRIPLVLALAGYIGVFVNRRRALPAFLSSSAFIVGLVWTVFASLFPMILRSRGVGPSLSVFDHTGGEVSMRAGLFWWGPGILLAGGYFWWVMRHFRSVSPLPIGQEGQGEGK